MSFGTTARPSLARGSGDESPANPGKTPPKWQSNDQQSTKPKVTGSNPVGRALRRRLIPLNGAKCCGAVDICLIRSKPLFLSSSRIGLSPKQARGLLRDKTHSVDRLGALPYPISRRVESGPRYVCQEDPLSARVAHSAVPIRPVVPGTARDASLCEIVGSSQFDPSPPSICVDSSGTRIFGRAARVSEIPFVDKEMYALLRGVRTSSSRVASVANETPIQRDVM